MKRPRGEEGNILFLTLMILIVIGLLSVGLMNIAITERENANILTQNMEDFYSAENCLEEGLKWLEVNHAIRKMPTVELGAEDKTKVYTLLLDASFEEVELVKVAKCKVTIEDVSGFAAGSEVDDGAGYGDSVDLGRQKYFKVFAYGIRGAAVTKSVYSYVLFSL